MNDLPRRVLCDLLARYGSAVADDPRRTRAFLSDLCGMHEQEIFALRGAQDANVCADLRTLSAGMLPAIRLAQVTKRVQGETGLPEVNVRWAVESWALALGVISHADLTITGAGAPHVPAPTGVPPLNPVVDAGGGGHYRRISDALAVIEPGAQIVVRPGVYREELSIDKRLEISGDGAVDDIVIEPTDGPGHRIDGDAALRGMTLRAYGRSRPALTILGGQPVIEDSVIVGTEAACIAIVGSAARPILRRCSIRNGLIGVFIDDGQGLLVENDITGQSGAGVSLVRGADVVLRGNHIHDGAGCGVRVDEGGHGLLEENEIDRNAGPGVLVTNGGDPTLRGNRIHDGFDVGIEVTSGGRGSFGWDEIVGNATAGVKIADGADPVLRRERISGGAGTGVFILKGGRGTIERCEIMGNAKAGITISSGGEPTLRENRIHDNGDAGVFAYKGGRGNLEGNEIWGNAKAGVTIRDGADPCLRRNVIRDGRTAGVFVYAHGKGCFEEDQIQGNAGAGVEIAAGGDPTLRRCRINRNGFVAVRVEHDGAGTVQECDLTDNAGGAWSVRPGGHTRREANIE